MSRPPSASQPSRRQSTNPLPRDDDTGLSQSLNQLSLSGRRVQGSPNPPKPLAPLKPPSRHASPSPRRPPSRSPSAHGRDSRAVTPPLIRKASMNSLHSANGIAPGPVRSVSRRSSLGQVMSPTARSPIGSPIQPERPPPLTPNSVASGYFQAELEAHHGPVSTLQTETVVILNDAVYGHRFSRPRTSRTALSTIVERPERIKAGVLGVSTAYVRLGERHSDGAFPVYPGRNIQRLPSIPFRIHKTTRTLPLSSPAVTNVHGVKWMEELKIMCDSAESILARGGKELQRPAMNRGTDHAAPEKLHEGDLYLCSESLDAMEGALGAVCEAVDMVFSTGTRRAFVAVRPPGHHCAASLPSGFCWVNNVHVGIMHAMLNHGLTHAAIIDFDLHHGDGSQSITWSHNSRAAAATKNASAWKKTSIGYFSLHDINSYPCEMGDEEKIKNASICIDNAHGQTAWNVHLHPWKSEQEFWEVYQTKYVVLLEKTRDYLRAQSERLKDANQAPKAAIFLSAGFDASEWESAGMQRHQVNVPTEFYARLTQDVIQLAAEEGLSVDGRVISILEGGYSDRALMSGIFSHLSGLVGNQKPRNTLLGEGGLSVGTGQKAGALNNDAELPMANSLASIHPYDPSWWAASELEKLEDAMSRPESPVRKPRSSTPTYCSPTHASTAKALEPLRTRRSMSALSSYGSKVSGRPLSPPPPEVPWTIAAHELSKLLIPSDRQTDSCTAEDLNAEATRVRRDRQSPVEQLDPAGASGADRPTSRMALRERKPRAIGPIDEEGSVQVLKTRRKTVAPSVISTEKVGMPTTEKRIQATSRDNLPPPSVGQPLRRTSRRLSASSIVPTPEGHAPCAPINEEEPSLPATSGGGPTQSAGKMPLKKARTTTTRKEPAPQSPHGTRKTMSPASTAVPASSSPDAAADDVDNITKGMKKIKINLITQSQKEAREQARLEGQKTAPQPTRAAQGAASGAKRPVVTPEGKTPRSTTARRAPMDASSQVVSPEASIPALTTTSESGFSTPVLEHDSSRTVSPEARQATPRANSPAVRPLDETGRFFVSYQPDGLAPQEPLKCLPPNMSSPSANTLAAAPSSMKNQENLFQYASGEIPFAPRPQSNQKAQRSPSPKRRVDERRREAGPGDSVWDVPETPRK